VADADGHGSRLLRLDARAEAVMSIAGVLSVLICGLVIGCAVGFRLGVDSVEREQ